MVRELHRRDRAREQALRAAPANFPSQTFPLASIMKIKPR